jgi:hypothetical protein
MKTAAEAWQEEFESCALLGMDAAECRRHADHAEHLQARLIAGEWKCEPGKRREWRLRHHRATAFTTLPSNARELRSAAERAAVGQRHAWWFAVAALASCPGGGMPGLRRGMLGPKLAGRILGLTCKTDWVVGTMRKQDRAGYAQAVAFGRALVVRWEMEEEGRAA